MDMVPDFEAHKWFPDVSEDGTNIIHKLFKKNISNLHVRLPSSALYFVSRTKGYMQNINTVQEANTSSYITVFGTEL